MILWEDYYARQCVHGRYAPRCRVCCAHLARQSRNTGPSWPLVAAAILWLLVLPWLAASALTQEDRTPLQTLPQRLGADR